MRLRIPIYAGHQNCADMRHSSLYFGPSFLPPSWGRFFATCNSELGRRRELRAISVNKKSRGRPKKAGGVDPVSAVRLPSDLTEQVDAWGEDRELNRSEAIRRLVELGLKAKK